MSKEKTPMEEIIEKSHELMGHNNDDGTRSFDYWLIFHEDRLLELEKKLLNQNKDGVVMVKQHNRITELEDFIEELINHSYMYGSDYYDRGIKLLKKDE